jgi:transcriptional regulator with XRE-family HTH domain
MRRRNNMREMTEQSRRHLARQIKSLRGRLSQEEFAKKLGMPRTTLSRLENARRACISLRTLLRIAAKLDISLVVYFDDRKKFALESAPLRHPLGRPRHDVVARMLPSTVITHKSRTLSKKMEIQ